ncbi:MAG: hypothetical protein ACYS0I_08170 [Planctomycetota bacterium]
MQKRKSDFNIRGLLEKETWKMDNGREVFDLDDGAYISKQKAEELKMYSVEPPALMQLAKREDYFGNNGIVCFLRNKEIYYSSEIVEINPPFEVDFEPEYDIRKDFE